MPNHETRPAWFEAQEELGRLHALMVELEEHVEKHDRREFESCDACDTEFYLARTRLDRHVELWASIWAKQAPNSMARRSYW